VNAKQAKRLRRQAREMSPGDDRRYSGIMRQRHGSVVNSKGETVPVVFKSRQAVLSNCQKGTYRKLKILASPL
jgi:hypothetical protein